MDVLADVVARARLGRVSSIRTVGHRPWALALPSASVAAFHIVVEGSGWVTGPGGESQPLGPGDVVLLPRGDAHVLASDLETRPVRFDPEIAAADAPVGGVHVGGSGSRTVMLCGAYALDNERQHPLLSTLPRMIHVPATRGRVGGLPGAVDLLAAEVQSPGLGTSAIAASLVDALLVYILREWLTSQTGPCAGWGSALTDPAVGAALTAMHERPEHPWTVARLATVAGFSRAAFARRFTALTGQPPLTYLTDWRMSLAAARLRGSQDSVAEVGRRVGYASEFAFGRTFKRVYGLPPGSYRRLTMPTTASSSVSSGAP